MNLWNERIAPHRTTPCHAMPRHATPSYSQGVLPRLNVTVRAIPRTYTRVFQPNERSRHYIYVYIYKCLFREMRIKCIDSLNLNVSLYGLERNFKFRWMPRALSFLSIPLFRHAKHDYFTGRLSTDFTTWSYPGPYFVCTCFPHVVHSVWRR